MDSSDDLDSLFEGMVLIDHSFPSSPPIPTTPTPPHPPIPTPSTSTPPPPPADDHQPTLAPEPHQPQLSQPLDENLFSDLTFFNASTIPDDQTHQREDDHPIIPSTPTSTPNTTPLVPARHPSRKKKRGAIRIGYGRPVSDPEPPTSIPPSLSPSSAQPTLPSPSSANIAAYSSPLEEEVVTHPSIPSHAVTDSHPSPAAANFTPTPQVQSAAEESADSSHVPLPEDKDPVVDAEDKKAVAVEESAAIVAHLDDAADKSTQVNQEGDKTAAAAAEAHGSSIDEAKLDSIRAQIAEKLVQIQEMADTVSTMRKEAARQRRKEEENVNSVSAKHKDLERQLEEACEAEDFERAESVSESLAAAEREKEGFLNALREAEADCDSMDTKMQEVLALQIAAEEEAVTMLHQFTKVIRSSLGNSLELVQFRTS